MAPLDVAVVDPDNGRTMVSVLRTQVLILRPIQCLLVRHLPAGAADDAWNVFVPWPDHVSTVGKEQGGGRLKKKVLVDDGIGIKYCKYRPAVTELGQLSSTGRYEPVETKQISYRQCRSINKLSLPIIINVEKKDIYNDIIHEMHLLSTNIVLY